ncbi:MAG: DUF2971 domain-containing protein [Puniceicoccales bacterium]
MNMMLPVDLSSPDLLFHYTSVQVALEKILSDGTLRFAPYSSTDDPLEFSDYYHAIIGTDEEIIHIRKQVPAFEAELEKAKMICFCQSKGTPDNSFDWGCSRSRMWSQYASGHRGVCLVFSKEQLLKDIPRATSKTTDLFDGEVKYDNEPKKLRSEHRILRKQCPSVSQVANDYYFYKREDYRDENEYRLVLHDNSFSSDSSEYIECIDALSAIILGCRTPDCYNGLFLDVATQRSVPTLKTIWSTGRVLFPPINK